MTQCAGTLVGGMEIQNKHINAASMTIHSEAFPGNFVRSHLPFPLVIISKKNPNGFKMLPSIKHFTFNNTINGYTFVGFPLQHDFLLLLV